MDTRELVVEDAATILDQQPQARWPVHGHATRPRLPATRRVSVIIPAHNEEAYLQQTLTALAHQKHPACEIIVVANGCSDHTAEVARGRCHRLIIMSQKSLGVARNLGARMAQGEVLVFLDADTLLDPDGLSVIAREFTEGTAAGTVKGQPDSDRLPYRLMYFLKNFTHWSGLHAGSSGVIICWRKDFVRLGGFDEALEVRENSELIRRLSRFGTYRYIAGTRAITSMRRYERRGMARMFWLWTRLWVQSFFSDLRNRKYEIIR